MKYKLVSVLRIRWTDFLLIVVVSLAAARIARCQEPCGSLQNHFGPYDYINPEHRSDKNGFNLRIVEQYHFTPQVESLKRGESTYLVGGDIGYTLRVWPNHHRALIAAVKFALKKKSERPEGMSLSIDCWFVRAKRMNPNDAMVHAIFSTYLAKRNRKEEALENAREAARLAPEDKNVQYNIAMAYTDAKVYDKAIEHAKRAQALGNPLPGVRNRLKSIGVWKE